MKNIQAQYQDLLEGKMTKANFMRNVRMGFPQYVSNTMNYDDAVQVLKGKLILNEEKKPIGVYGHNPNAENDLYRGIDHVNYYQAYKGIQFELAKEKEITDEVYVKVREKVVKNILKNPDAYKDLQLANFKAVKEMDEDLEMKEVKPDNHVDKANEMKVVKKDAPASANEVKKDNKKKEKIAQMTQAPKAQKGVEAFPTPGKEKVMALKEHIMEDLTSKNPHYEDFNVGSRVKKKDTEGYDASKVGNIEKIDGHTATVKFDDGSIQDVQYNVLTKKEIPQHPKAAEKFGQIPDSPFMKKEEEVKESEASLLEKIKQKLFKAIDKLKKEGSVITTQGGEAIGSDRNDSAAFNKARDLERRTGDQLKITNTRTGVTRQV